MPATIEKSKLGALVELGEGGEGRVYAVGALNGVVYKEFRRDLAAELDPGALARTMSLLDGMTSGEASFVRERSAWPHTAVVESGVFHGFLMPAVPDLHYCTHGLKEAPGRKLCTWDLLAYRERTRSNPVLQSDSSHVEQAQVLALVLDLAKLFEILHRHRIVVGDLSGRNLLWTAQSPSRVMLIDCDGCRVEGTRAVTRSKQSPDWFDPSDSGETSLESDRYKLAIAIFRAYFSATTTNPSSVQVDRQFDPAGFSIHQLALRAAGSDRPTATEWVTVLEGAKRSVELGGRPLIDLDPVEPPLRHSAFPRQRMSLPLDPPTLDGQ